MYFLLTLNTTASNLILGSVKAKSMAVAALTVADRLHEKGMQNVTIDQDDSTIWFFGWTDTDNTKVSVERWQDSDRYGSQYIALTHIDEYKF